MCSYFFPNKLKCEKSHFNAASILMKGWHFYHSIIILHHVEKPKLKYLTAVKQEIRFAIVSITSRMKYHLVLSLSALIVNNGTIKEGVHGMSSQLAGCQSEDLLSCAETERLCSSFASSTLTPIRIDNSEIKTSGESIMEEKNDCEPYGGTERSTERGELALLVAFSCSC